MKLTKSTKMHNSETSPLSGEISHGVADSERPNERRRAVAAGMLLALEWDDRNVVAVEARLLAGRLSVTHYFEETWPDGVSVKENPDAAASWLKRRLHEAGIRATRTIVTVPRAVITLKQLQVPDAADDDLPRLVQLQAEARSSLAEGELDFVPLRKCDDGPGRTVLLATIPGKVIASYSSVLQKAKLRLVSLTPAPLAAAEVLLNRAGRPLEEPNLLISSVGPRVELSLITRRQLAYSHAVRLHGESDHEDGHAVVTAVSRMLAGINTPLAAGKPERIWLLGGAEEHGLLCSALENHLGCEAELVNPFEGMQTEARFETPKHTSAFAGPVGALLLASGSPRPAMNFVSPRKTPVRKSRVKAALCVAVMLAIAVLGSLWSYRNNRLQDIDREIGRLTAADAAIRLEIEQEQPFLNAVTSIETWNANNVRWLDELVAFTEKLPDTQQCYLVELTCDAERKDALGSIKATGYTTKRDHVMALNRRFLADRQRFELVPHGIRPSRSDEHYPSRFDVEVRILRPFQTGDETRGSSAVSPKNQSQPPADASQSERAGQRRVSQDVKKRSQQ